MLRWVTGRRRLWETARRLRQEIRAARAGARPRRSDPPFAELLAEAIRLQEAGLGYVVRLTAERVGTGPWEQAPERVLLAPDPEPRGASFAS